MTDTHAAVVPTQRPAPEVVEQAIRLFHQLWVEWVAACPGGKHEVRDRLVRARCGFPVAPFNGVWGLDPNIALDVVLAAVDEFVSGDLPWNVQLRPPYADGIEDEFARRGLVRTEDIPFMVLTDVSRLATATEATPATFRRAVAFRDIDEVITLLEQGFGMPPELTRESFPVALLTSREITSWIATASENVSTSMGYLHGGMCGVFNVATPEQHRGNGYGAAVTAHTVQQAFAAGAKAAYLQASPLGHPVYERLGFITVERWRQWMPKEYIHHAD